MKISYKFVEPNIHVVAVDGRFTKGSESLEMQHIVEGLVAKGERRFVFDLSEASFIDDACVGILAFCAGTIGRAEGQMRFVMSPKIMSTFRALRIGWNPPLSLTVEAACQELTADAGKA